MISRCLQCAASLGGEASVCPHCGNSLVGERREATVLFCDLGGYTAWLEEDEPEEVAMVIDRFKRRSIHVLEVHGGIANQFVGDEVVGLFGVRATHEDDPCRAVAAALVLHAFVRMLQSFRPNGEARALRLHTGIETGLVYTRVRDPRAGLYDVTGDVVNTAARLRSIAQRDEIVVGPTAYRRIAPFFRLEAQQVTPMRGKARSIVPYRVLGPAASSSFFDAARARGLTSHVGRAAEMEQLDRAWQAACRGLGQVITVEGVAGVGKTRLLHELRRRVATSAEEPRVLILHGRCNAYGEVTPYQPFIDAISRVLTTSATSPIGNHDAVVERLRALDPSLESSFPVYSYLLASGSLSPELVAGGEQLRDAIVDALARLLLPRADARPVLAVFEDWHWADEASRDALRIIAQRAALHGVLIVVNYRCGEVPSSALPSCTRHILLEPVGKADTQAIACSVLGADALPDGLGDFVYERTLGNPFFIEEVCRSLLDDGAVARQADAVILAKPLRELGTPATVQSIVRARIDRLRSRHRQLLRLASIVGSEFSLEMVCALSRAHTGLERDGHAGDATAAAPTSTVLPIEAEVTAALAELEKLGLVDNVSASPEPTYRFKHAITQEVSYATIPLDQRRDLHGRLAEAMERSGATRGREVQHETLAHHYGLSAQREKAIEYALLTAEKAWRAFSPRQAERLYSRAVCLIDSVKVMTPDRKRMRIDACLNWMRAGVYNPTRAQVEALRVSHALAIEIGYARGASLCLNWMGWTEQGLGNLDRAIEYTHGFLESAKKLDDTALVAQATMNLGLNHAFAGNYDFAIDCLERGMSMRSRPAGAAYRYAQGQLALIMADRGHFSTAHALMEQALCGTNRAGQVTMQAPLLVQRAMVEAWQGAFDACVETAGHAHEIATRIEAQYIQAMSSFLQGYAGFMARRGPPCIEAMQGAVAFLDDNDMRLMLAYCYGLLAESLLVAGDLDSALACSGKALARAEFGDRSGEIAAHRIMFVVADRRGDAKQSELHVQRTLELATAKRSARELAITRYRMAELLLRRGRRTEATEPLEGALAGFREMRMDSYLANACSLRSDFELEA